MFQIGEFSRLARVTKRQLRHYDDYGLLIPAHIDTQTGYRYYSATQLPRLHRILALKDLGLTLDQIRQLLNEELSADEMRGMLLMKKKQLEITVQEEIMRIQNIEDRINQIDIDGGIRDYEVTIQSIPEKRILSTREIVPNLPKAIEFVYEINHLLPLRAGRSALGELMIIPHSEEWLHDNIDVEVGFVLEYPITDKMELSDGRTLTVRTLPALDKVASLVRTGLFNDQLGCYGSLGLWIENSGYEMAGTGREIFIEGFQPGKESETVVEIQLPIRKTDGLASA